MISKFRLDIMEDTSVDLLNGLNEDKRLKMDLVTTVVCVCVCVGRLVYPVCFDYWFSTGVSLSQPQSPISLTQARWGLQISGHNNLLLSEMVR